MTISANSLYQCDCLFLLERLETACTTLAYLDPPGYFKSADEWLCDQAEESWTNLGENTDSLQDHLDFIAKVLQQTRRVLTNVGSIYFHTNPHLSSYVRLLLDQIFGRDNFQTEIILPYRRFKKSYHRPVIGHEVILLYSKTENFIYNPPKRGLTEEEIQGGHKLSDEKGFFKLADLTAPLANPNLVYEWNKKLPPVGRSWKFSKERMQELQESELIHFSRTTGLPSLKIYLSESPEVEIGNIWDDITTFTSKAEKINFVAQRPTNLLKRIILAGSQEGDTVLDPFCGSGTTLVVAQENSRRWIGSDISLEAYSTSIKRIQERFKLVQDKDFKVGNQATIKNLPVFKNSYISIFPESKSYTQLITRLEKFARISNKPIVYVEGKTDRNIILTAWKKLYTTKDMPFEVKDCNLLPEDDNNVAAGASILAKFISTVRADNPHVAIAIFDRDKEGNDEYRSLPKYFKEISEVEAKVNENRKSVAFLLPIPPGKELYDTYLNLCIEFYFSEAALQQTTSEGRGLRFRYPEIETKIKRHGNPVIKVEASTIPETREIIEGKTIFAEKIVPKLLATEFESFKSLFEKIQKVLDYLADR